MYGDPQPSTSSITNDTDEDDFYPSMALHINNYDTEDGNRSLIFNSTTTDIIDIVDTHDENDTSVEPCEMSVDIDDNNYTAIGIHDKYDSFLGEIDSAPSVTQTPPHKKQYQQSKVRMRKLFDINKILGEVMVKDKQKILEKTMAQNPSQTNTFVEATLGYFRQLIRNARRSHTSKVEGAKILYRIFGERLEDADFQIWLVEKLWLHDRE